MKLITAGKSFIVPAPGHKSEMDVSFVKIVKKISD
jgi:hypothetical protein